MPATPGRGARPEVYEITDARRSLTADVRARTRRYLVSMGVRTACFFGAVLSSGVTRWTLLAGALVLPYIAVVVANGGREPSRDLPGAAAGPRRPALDAPQRPRHGAPTRPHHDAA